MVLPGVREEVAAIVVHLPNGEFFPFVPVGAEAAEVSWEVSRWGAWTVTAATPTHEVEVSGWIAPGDDGVGGTTVLRAPTDDAAAGMAPLCRESFKGTVRVSLWERDAAATWEGSGGGGGPRGGAGAERWGAGGVSWTPWSRTRRRLRWAGGRGRREGWSGSAEMREPLGSLAGAPVDVDAIAGFFKRVGVDIVPGL